MNWEKFQTYGQSSEKSFEMLCNQLFENWCKEECKDTLAPFVIVNGAGGDGGVESYAVLKHRDSKKCCCPAPFLTPSCSHRLTCYNETKKHQPLRGVLMKEKPCLPEELRKQRLSFGAALSA